MLLSVREAAHGLLEANEDNGPLCQRTHCCVILAQARGLQAHGRRLPERVPHCSLKGLSFAMAAPLLYKGALVPSTSPQCRCFLPPREITKPPARQPA